MVKIENETDYNYWKPKAADNFMVQQIVGDDEHEYTAAIFGRGNKEALPPIILRRKLSGEGATVKAVIEDIPELSANIRTSR